MPENMTLRVHEAALRSHEAIFRDQSRAGASMSETETKRSDSRTQRPSAIKKTAALKGHEAFLKALETSGAQVRIDKKSCDDVVIGTVKHSDKFTITMKIDNPDGSHTNRVIFKHDISEFSALTPRVESEALPVIQ